MGSYFSEKKAGGSEPTAVLPADTDFRDLEAGYPVVFPRMQVFDPIFQPGTAVVINLNPGVTARAALPCEALGASSRNMLEYDQAVAQVTLDSLMDTWKNKQWHDTLNKYFENSRPTFNFYEESKKCGGRAKEGLRPILLAVSYFDEESQIEGSGFERTLRQFEGFKEPGDPFMEEFSTPRRSVYEQQQKMLNSLEKSEDNVAERLRSSKTLMLVTNAISVVAFVSTLIVSGVAVAISAPAEVTGVMAGLAAPIGSLGKWCNTLWKNYRSALKQQKELLTLATGFTKLTIANIDTVNALVDKLEIEFQSMLATADLADGKETLKLAIEEIRKRLNVFMENVDKIGQLADQGSQFTRKARAIILQKITG